MWEVWAALCVAAAAVHRPDDAAAWYAACEGHAFYLPPILAKALPVWLKFSTMDFFGSVCACFGYRKALEAKKKSEPWCLALAKCTMLQRAGRAL